MITLAEDTRTTDKILALPLLPEPRRGVSFWCHSCKVPFLVTWEELDQLRAKRQSSRVLCRCGRWIGNIDVVNPIA